MKEARIKLALFDLDLYEATKDEFYLNRFIETLVSLLRSE